MENPINYWYQKYLSLKAEMNKMKAGAVEGQVIVPIYEGDDKWSAQIEIPGIYEIGEKVKVIVLKAEEE